MVTDRTVGNRWLIASGLGEGDQLITEGLQYIRPGTPVTVKPAGNVAEQQDSAAQPDADQ